MLYALHRLNFPLKVEIVTNIIHFTDDLCNFTSVFNLSLLKYSFDLYKKQSLLFYLKYIVLYELLNNPTPNFKYPILVSIIEEKYMKIFDARGYLTFLALSCQCNKESYICKFDIRIRALIKVCNVCYMAK